MSLPSLNKVITYFISLTTSAIRDVYILEYHVVNNETNAPWMTGHGVHVGQLKCILCEKKESYL